MRRSASDARARLLLVAGAFLTAGDADETDPPEVAIGERLFLETRFAQYFFAHATDLQAPLSAGGGRR